MEQGSNAVQLPQDVVGLPSAFLNCLLGSGGLWGKQAAGKGWRVTRLWYELQLLPKSGVTAVMAAKDHFLWASVLSSSVGDGSVDRHWYSALAYCLGLSDLCFPCKLHSGSSCGKQVQPWLWISILLDATQSQMVARGLTDHTASVHQAEKAGQAREAGSPAPATSSSCLVCSNSYFSKDL